MIDYLKQAAKEAAKTVVDELERRRQPKGQPEPLHILPAQLESAMRGRFASVLGGEKPDGVESRALRMRRISETGIHSGKTANPPASIVEDAETDAERRTAWAAVVYGTLDELGKDAAEILTDVLSRGTDRVAAASLYQTTPAAIFVYEQQALCRAAIRAACAGLIG